ncbi:SDR family oxidoreductase [Leptospira sp. 96542]|nr:SDR family oxidoreductase [Leptospira sp. 96542]
MKRVLVTGGFGFLGGRIARHLLESGHHVLLGSRTQNPVPKELKNAIPIQMNWENEKYLNDVCKNVDVIVHSAGMNADDCSRNPIAAFEFNCVGTMRLIEAAKHQGIKKFIYLSTAHVYKNPLEGNISEQSPIQNLHPYATSHAAAEFGVSYANSLNEFQGFILRLSNGFGAPVFPEVNCWKLLTNDLCKQAVQLKTLKIISSGLQQRDFVPITNITTTVEKVVDLNSKIIPTIFNLGSGVSMSIFEMAKKIQERCNVLFRYEPSIEVNSNSNEYKEKTPLLEYKVDLLKSNHLYTECNFESEIDDLLLFCKKNFGA